MRSHLNVHQQVNGLTIHSIPTPWVPLSREKATRSWLMLCSTYVDEETLILYNAIYGKPSIANRTYFNRRLKSGCLEQEAGREQCSL